MAVIGIDLGTSYSCVGVVKNGIVEIIANGQGNRVTPSIVAFSGQKRFVGDAAKTQSSQNPENTVYDAKRLIGRRFNEISAKDIKRWPFKVINQDGSPNIEVSFRNKREVFSPEQISAAVLTKMKETAEEYLNDDVTDAVITVPAYFTDSQRQATKDAAEIAGLNVLRLVNEPTAAAIAYGLKTKVSSDQNILVFDMGGGTFDVSILTIDDDLYQVKAVDGDTKLGGGDFNNKMLDYFLKEIAQKYGKDLSDDKHAISELLSQCELAKIALSTKSVADVAVKSLQGGFDFKSTMTRACFEELNANFFKKAIDIVENTIKQAKLTKAEIHEVVLVGGSTYIPKVQQMLQNCFNGKKLNKSIKLDEAVAYGAAVMAANLSDADEEFEMVLLDVIPHSLGVEHSGGLFHKIIGKNSTIPLEVVSHRFSTSKDNQTSVPIKIYEGENDLTVQNNFLGRFQLKGLTKAKAKELKISVKFKVNANGILEVSAWESNSSVENSLKIEVFRSGSCGYQEKNVTKNEIEEARNKIETFKLLHNVRKVHEKQLKDFHFKNGISSFNAGDYDKAFESFTEALKINPGLIEAMEKRAVIHFEREEFEECVIECEAILKIEKNKPKISHLKRDAQKKASSDEPWWKVLKVAKDATKSEVIKAFKNLVKKFHPDKSKKEILEVDKVKKTEKMAKINKAKTEFDIEFQ